MVQYVQCTYHEVISHNMQLCTLIHPYSSIILVPAPNEFNVTALDSPTVGQSLTLQCNVAAVRGITSRVDIVWSSNGMELERITGVVANDSIYILPVYIATYTLQVTTDDDNKAYRCEIVINTTPMVTATDSITLDVIGKFHTGLYTCVWFVLFIY